MFDFACITYKKYLEKILNKRMIILTKCTFHFSAKESYVVITLLAPKLVFPNYFENDQKVFEHLLSKNIQNPMMVMLIGQIKYV